MKKKGLKMPDTYVIIVGLITLVTILTWLLPAGSYDLDGKNIIPGTYHAVEKNPAGIGAFLTSFYSGLSKGASTIFIVLLIGGAFQILMDTGTIGAAISAVIHKTNRNYKLIIPSIMLVMSILGALGCGNNIALAFVPIMLSLLRQLDLDKIVVIAALRLASNTGFSASPINPFTVLLAQNIAGVQPLSGAGPRLIMWAVFTALVIWYTMRYCKKIKVDPSKALAPFTAEDDAEFGITEDHSPHLNIRHVLCLITLAGTFIVFSIGSIKWNWDLPMLGACMMALAFLSGIIGGLGPNRMAKSFVNGAKGMVYSAMLIGFASAISVIMTNANIIHTIIYHLCQPLNHLPLILSAAGMFVVNFIFNFFVPSGSGQCYITMPIMAPMADILGLSRQVAISAFQFGDGLCNACIPTSSLLMGSLGMAHISFGKWQRFVLPITGLLCACSIIFLAVMTLIGWT